MIIVADAMAGLAQVPNESVQCCVTSPPYWGLRDYGVDGQLGLEKTPTEYVNNMRLIFEQVKRVLKPDGTLWLNLGDSYARNGGTPGGGNRELLHLEGKQKRMTKVPDASGLKAKDLVGIPWAVAFALRADGWYLRQDIIWHKPNPMPESVRDRCTKAHEYVFLLSKSAKYYYDIDSIREPCKWPHGPNSPNSPNSIKSPYGQGFTRNAQSWHDHEDDLKQGNRIATKINHPLGKNKRSVWTISTAPLPGAHFATFPMKLIEPCIKAGCPEGGTVLDPFFGAGTTGIVAQSLGRNWIGIELNAEYAKMAEERIKNWKPPKARKKNE